MFFCSPELGDNCEMPIKFYYDPVLHKFIDLAKGSSCSSPKSHTIDSPEVVKHLIKTIQPLKMPEGSTF
jgi:hypothetical protein